MSQTVGQPDDPPTPRPGTPAGLVPPQSEVSDGAQTARPAEVAWVLRQAATSDVAELARFERRVFGTDAWSADMIGEELAGPLRHYLVAELDSRFADASRAGTKLDRGRSSGRILAYAGAYLGPDATDIMTIGVLKTARRGGIGRALLAALLDAARQAGSRQAFLDVRVDNDPAIALYRSFGFEPVSLRRGYYHPDGVDGLVMRLDLAAPAARQPAGIGRASEPANPGVATPEPITPAPPTPEPETIRATQAIGWSSD